MRNTLEISGILLAVLLAAMAFHAWLTEHDDRLRLQATIATQKQALDAADVRERDRAVTLKDTVAQIDALKRATQTPAQVVRDLPKVPAAPSAHHAFVTRKRIARSSAGDCEVRSHPVRWKEGMPFASRPFHRRALGIRFAGARIPYAPRASKSIRTPRRSHRADSRRRS